MDVELVWRGIRAANPWWDTRQVPGGWTRSFRRPAFAALLTAIQASERGRGVVVLGPRRVGKTVLLHQITEQLLADGADPRCLVHLALDDVGLRGADLGQLLDLVDQRVPVAGRVRTLLLDEVQHTPQWSGWLKRVADRRDPYVFLATGSSATALRHGTQDAGIGRWKEFVLYPWSFWEHVQYRNRERKLPEPFAAIDRIRLGQAGDPLMDSLAALAGLATEDHHALDEELVDYFVRGGFPEVLDEDDRREAQRHLRQDILDRALGRDIADTDSVDHRVLERMFLRVCEHPGQLWHATNVANDLDISRPTVARYLELLERAFLLFSWPNLGSPVKGQPKVYLVAPSLRAALFNLDHDAVRGSDEWGRLAENVVIASLNASASVRAGFWRSGADECDGVLMGAHHPPLLAEVKAGGGTKAARGLLRAASALDISHGFGFVLTRQRPERIEGYPNSPIFVTRASVATWLYAQGSPLGAPFRVG